MNIKNEIKRMTKDLCPVDIPKKEIKYFEKFFLVCSRILLMLDDDEAKLKEINVLKVACVVHKIVDMYNDDDYDGARELMGQFICERQMERDIFPRPFSFEQAKKVKKNLEKDKEK